MTRKIEDAGEAIPGARKFGAGTPMVVADLEGMSQAERVMLATKDNVWPTPDYASLVADGMTAEAAAMIKIIRDRIGAKPRYNIRQLGTETLRDPLLIAHDYVRMLGIAREHLSDGGRIRSLTDVSVAIGEILDAIDWKSRRHDDETRHLLASINKSGSKTSPLHIDKKDLIKVQKMVSEGFPKPAPSWRRGIKIYRDWDGTYFVARRKQVLQRGLESQQEAVDWLNENMEALKQSTARTATTPRPERPHLDKIVRKGGRDHRGGRDIADGETFLETFGFRGVQFGEWLPDNERQEVLNHAYDALMDLADVLKVEPEHLSLGGSLAISFGARGRGKAVAHYEPGQRVLNLTRLKGAGSLAHEFAHALDHWSGNPENLETPPAHPGGIPSGTGWQQIRVERGKFLTNLEPSQAEKWEALVKAFYWKADTGDEKPRRSDYLREAARLNGSRKSYWTEPTEMFARAFESWVFDELANEGVENPYLVHGVEEDRFANGYQGNPYPSGDERQLLNERLQKLIDEMRPDLAEALAATTPHFK